MKAQYRIKKYKYGGYYIQRKSWLFGWVGDGAYSWDRFSSIDEAKQRIAAANWSLELDKDGKEIREVSGDYLLRPTE